MKKLFNLRLPVLYAASLAAGIFYSAVLGYFGLDSLFIVIPVALAFCLSAIYGAVKKDLLKTVELVIAAAVFLLGAVYMYLLYAEYIRCDFLCGELVKVSGTVDESGTTSAGNVYIVIKNVSVNGKNVSGKVVAYLSDTAGDYCRKGYAVEFYSQLAKENFISAGEINHRAVDGIKYSCNIFGSLKARYRFSLFGEMNYAVQSVLFDNLDNETAAVAYAMLTGNTGHISSGTLNSFRYGGIAHVFAVSGLHIGVIYGSISFVFKLVGVNRFASAAVKIFFIVMFAGMCGFSPSSVRAVIMCSVSAVASCSYKKYDGLNALAVAGIILLLINPLYLFGAGFILSFSAMLGIMLLSKNLKRAFGFLPEKISDSLSVGISAQLGVMPASMAIFGYISAAGLFLNLVIVPVISVFYVQMFFLTAFGAAIPAVGGALVSVACVPVRFLINLAVSCGFENSLIGGDYGVWIYIPFAAVTLLVTDRINLGVGVRSFAALIVSSLALIALSSSSPAFLSEVTFGTGYDGGFVYLSVKEGNVLVITEDYSGYESKYLDGADVLVVLGGDYSLNAVFNNGGAYREVYLRDGIFPIKEVGPISVNYSDDFKIFDIDFRFDGGDLYITAEMVTFTVSLKYKGDIYGDMPEYGALRLHCFENQRTVLFTREGESYGLDVCGNMQYTIKDGRYRLCGAVPKE